MVVELNDSSLLKQTLIKNSVVPLFLIVKTLGLDS